MHTDWVYSLVMQLKESQLHHNLTRSQGGAYIVHKFGFGALVYIPGEAQVSAEGKGLHDSESRGMDVTLLHIPHHTSQSGLGLFLPV